MADSPAFGQADLSNCERELIHLAGSVQPHGLLVVIREERPGDAGDGPRANDRVVVQITDNAATLFGRAAEHWLAHPRG